MVLHTLIAVATLFVLPIFARKRGDNCIVEWSQRGECGSNLACTATGVSYAQCAPAKSVGDRCLGNADCARGLRCRQPDLTCRAAFGAGEDCIDVGTCDVRENVTCKMGKCVPLRVEGVACVFRIQCDIGMFCDGYCRERRGVGESCSTYDACVDGTSCVGGVCVLWPSEGEACARGEVGIGGRPTGVFYSNCAANLDCVDSKCVARKN